jgi:heme/copper-type cytochrome/quinol oxidase subunit 1
LLGVLGALAVAAIASVFSAVGALSSLTGYTTFGAAHIYATVVALPILAIAAGATMWTSQIFGGRKLASIINAPAMLATVGGIVLTVIAEYLSGIANSPWLIADSSAVSILAIQDPISESTFRSLSALTAVAYAIAALGVVLFVAAFKLAMYGFAKPAKVSRTNGVTLEWAANPQLAYNFETVPPVFGPAPLIGLDDQPATSNELVEATK